VFQDLPCARNFFAHRNGDTERSAISLGVYYGVSAPSCASDLPSSRARGRPRTIIEEWIDDIDTVTELLCD